MSEGEKEQKKIKRKGKKFWNIHKLIKCCAFGIIGMVYYHHCYWMIPYYYENDSMKDFKISVEWALIYFSFSVLVSTFYLAGAIEPGYIYNHPEKKLSQKGFEELKKRTKEANDLKEFENLKSQKDISKNLECDLKSFKDNFGYGMYCNRCEMYRYPRSHHCSICNTCSFFMDHHCVWLDNCIGINNLRYFLTFLFVASLSTFYYNVCAFPHYYSLVTKHGFVMTYDIMFKINKEDLFEMSAYHMGLAVTVVLGFYFVKIMNHISRGLSSLERTRDNTDNTYQITFDQYWDIIFGKTYYPLCWIFTPWIAPRSNVDKVMKEYYGFEIERK